MLNSDVIDNILDYFPIEKQIKISNAIPFEKGIKKIKDLLNYEIVNCRCQICYKIPKKGEFSVLCAVCYDDTYDRLEWL